MGLGDRESEHFNFYFIFLEIGSGEFSLALALYSLLDPFFSVQEGVRYREVVSDS